jgi:hypothetical protein
MGNNGIVKQVFSPAWIAEGRGIVLNKRTDLIPRRLAALCAMIAAAATIGAQQSGTETVSVVRATLDNGMRVIVVRDPLAPVVTVEELSRRRRRNARRISRHGTRAAESLSPNSNVDLPRVSLMVVKVPPSYRNPPVP